MTGDGPDSFHHRNYFELVIGGVTNVSAWMTRFCTLQWIDCLDAFGRYPLRKVWLRNHSILDFSFEMNVPWDVLSNDR